MKLQLLGGLEPREFLARYWQKRPLLVRQAVPGFEGVLTRDELFALVRDDSVESRLVERRDTTWSLRRGPFPARELKRRRSRPWTVLLQGANLWVPDADRLLRRFSFIPFARLDDLMVSYATHGGGVGPHYDSYDVFLLQGSGRRRWQIGAQRDLALLDDSPLKLLKNFRPARELILEPGDMLYLPPRHAHNGIAEGECMTYSVGFRAPSVQELMVEFLAYMQEHVRAQGYYRDPDLAVQKHPAEIAAPMIDQVVRLIGRMNWNRPTIREFLGCFLTEPKPAVFFSPPSRPRARRSFLASCLRHGLALNSRTQLLFSGSRFFLNGEPVSVDIRDSKVFRRLADKRRLDPSNLLSNSAIDLLYEWYRLGFLAPSA
jgi:50S ribosomal protein L16 3-hydroxylase